MERTDIVSSRLIEIFVTLPANNKKMRKCVISIILYEEEDIRQPAEMETGETG